MIRIDVLMREACDSWSSQQAVGEPGSFVIQAKDQFSNLSTRGGDRFKVTAGSAALVCSVTDLSDGTHQVKYQCDEAGQHRLAITIGMHAPCPTFAVQ